MASRRRLTSVVAATTTCLAMVILEGRVVEDSHFSLSSLSEKRKRARAIAATRVRTV